MTTQATSQWRIAVDRACRRSGICTAQAPRYFTVDDQLRTRPVDELVAPDGELIEVVEACPAEAISVTDLRTGRSVVQNEE
ncbi:ferredoxin [Streptomyces sp. NBC_00829]|uniref:ferredoxin n=1 Tax=Streptomyces sp. NBC_00829 TaxID=2903679 RepID=UPI003865085A|nr:ferredoxin [Streptomyces sp. NBC_00829]